MSKIEQLQNIIEQIKAIAPMNRRFDIDNVVNEVQKTKWSPKPHIYVFDFETYEEGTAFLRSLGFQKREKQPQTGGTTHITGDSPTLAVTCYCKTLPPTCHLVKTKKLVPKKTVQTIESNEMVEVEVTEVVCTGGNDEAKSQTL